MVIILSFNCLVICNCNFNVIVVLCNWSTIVVVNEWIAMNWIVAVTS